VTKRFIVGGVVAALAVAGCSSMSQTADPASDAPEARARDSNRFTQASSYDESLRLWRDAEDLNAWIGARFQYDTSRAIRLSETQRQKSGRLAILKPEEFFDAPRGVCVDLSRFAVESLRTLDPKARPTYLMIEFDPVSLAGNTLRRHWLAAFERDGKRYFFADSKRPGFLSGPYESTQAFISEYERYRGRRIVSFREAETYERRLRSSAAAQSRPERPLE
jgi:hypothetical protein